MSAISVVILTKNESHNIKDCMQSCTFADEFIIVDDSSDDETREIASSLGGKVFSRSMDGDWGAQQTFGIQQASCDWIFFIDADERCTPELCKEIEQVVSSVEPDRAYRVQRLNHFAKKRIHFGPLSPDWVCRLLPREGGSVTGFVHPQINHVGSELKLKSPMLHFTYETWDQYEKKMQKYAMLAAKKYFAEGKGRPSGFALALRPIFAFLKMYLLKLGFLDGAMGFALSLQYSAYTLSKYFRLRELYDKK